MDFLKRIFGNGKDTATEEKPNGKDRKAKVSPLDKKPNRKTGSSMFCNLEEQRRRDAEVEATQKVAGESHRDLTQTIRDFNGKKPKEEDHGALQTPQA